MTLHHDDPPSKADQGALPSARPSPPRPTSPPTPVRAAMDAEADDAAVPVPEREFHVDGRPWRARLLGRAAGGASMGPTPLVLLGFFEGDAERPAREILVVGNDLDSLSPTQLDEAWAAARAPMPDELRGAPLFPGVGGDRRGGR